MSLQLHHPCGKSDYSDAFLKDSAKKDPRMSCCLAVSTDFQRSLTIGRPPRDCDLSRIPSLPDRSAPSTDLLYVPSRPRYDRTDLVRAVKQIRIFFVNNVKLTIDSLIKVSLRNKNVTNISLKRNIFNVKNLYFIIHIIKIFLFRHIKI